jgi:hypothetical protein
MGLVKTVRLMLLAGAALSCFAAGARADDRVFPVGSGVTVSRTQDRLFLVPAIPIEVTVTVANSTAEPIRGVCFAEHIPAVFGVETAEVSIDGTPVDDYGYEVSGRDIYPHTDAHRWILEEPGDYEAMDNPVPPGGTLTIVYRITTAEFYSGEWPPYFFSCEFEQPLPQYCFGYCDDILPINRDDDGDRMADAWEIQYFSDLTRDGAEDADDDGLSDMDECHHATNPLAPDTDGDNITDYIEINSSTDPLNQSSTPWPLFINFQPAGSASYPRYCPADTSAFSARGLGWR